MNRVDQHFRLQHADFVSGTKAAWICRYCGQAFPTVDRTGRANVIGRKAHIAKHVRAAGNTPASGEGEGRK